jgi:cold shock CspA family protein
MTGIITADSNRGFFWCEVDGTHQSVFIHQKSVKAQRHLHVMDRVSLDLEPNPRKPGAMHGVRVEYIGRCIARQVSDREGAL